MNYRKFRFIAFAAVSCAGFLASSLGVAHAFAVPELDTGSATSAVALLVGGALLILERFRRR